MSEFNQRSRAKINPLGVGVSFPKPTISQALNLAVSPLVVGVTLLTPNTTTAPSALSVAVTLVTPTVAVV